ncbi:MAG: ATP-binding protein [Phycisphaerae bacterium]|nr:ATP-binding protein [Phycisphaerae bacterium]
MDGWWLAIGVLVGGPLGVLATLWLTRRLWRGARRLSARARGKEHFAELGQLAAGLAHEIKNPLSTININLQLLVEDLEHYRDETHGRWLRRLLSVQEETGRLKGILDDFLQFAGKVELNPTVTDLRALMGELTDFFMPQAEAARVVLRTALPETPVSARVDGKLLKQALLNLMLNAVQAMDRGGELLIRLSAARSQALIEVTDTGPGIPTEHLPKVFQVYFSTKSGGSGLGLPTTRRIIREHGGDIRVQSALGKGTRFVISLPLAKG